MKNYHVYFFKLNAYNLQSLFSIRQGVIAYMILYKTQLRTMLLFLLL